MRSRSVSRTLFRAVCELALLAVCGSVEVAFGLFLDLSGRLRRRFGGSCCSLKSVSSKSLYAS